MKQILINAFFPNELRTAEIDANYLCNLHIENYTRARLQSNIYKGIISKHDSGVASFFVNYGNERQGFLPEHKAKRINVNPDNNQTMPPLQAGDELIVQVSIDKTEQDQKGAVLTTEIRLAGRYLILLPTKPGEKQIPNSMAKDNTTEVEELINGLKAPKEIGFSLRTSAFKVDVSLVKKELHALTKLWAEILEKSEASPAPALLLREHNAAIRVLRDRLDESIDEVIVDTPEMFEMLKAWVNETMPEHLHKIILYENKAPLFQTYDIEDQVNLVYERCVPLSSGGNLIIDHTSAMTTIDINSSRGGSKSMEETALQTNLEAVKEIARQLRLRDIGGQIAIDLIDMRETKNCQNVETQFRKYMHNDVGNPKIDGIGAFCLLLMTRKRIRPSISDSFDEPCNTCGGTGRIRTERSAAMSVLREVQRLAATEENKYISVLTSVPVCSILFNDYRENIHAIEKNQDAQIVIAPDPMIKSYESTIKAGLNENNSKTFKQPKTKDRKGEHYIPAKNRRGKPVNAAVKHQYKSAGLFQRFYAWLGIGRPDTKRRQVSAKSHSAHRRRKQYYRSDNRSDNRGDNRSQNRPYRRHQASNGNAVPRQDAYNK